jgi:hypothetical protein
MINNIIKEMEKVESENISGIEKKKIVLNIFKKEFGEYYNVNSYLLSTIIDFVVDISKEKFHTTINNKQSKN